jgi:hypothetical protein
MAIELNSRDRLLVSATYFFIHELLLANRIKSPVKKAINPTNKRGR